MTRGDFDVGRSPPPRVAEQRDHLVADDLHDLLRRRQAPQDVLAHRALADAVDERLDDLEVDVGLEQRHADLAQRRLDGRLRQPRLAAQRPEDVLEAIAERIEHHAGREDTRALTPCRANSYRSWRRAALSIGSPAATG